MQCVGIPSLRHAEQPKYAWNVKDCETYSDERTHEELADQSKLIFITMTWPAIGQYSCQLGTQNFIPNTAPHSKLLMYHKITGYMQI